jgi:two-component system phosphate regulon sensor histidine kinase PhoR
MHRKRLLWQLYPAFLLISLFLLLAVTWHASRSLRQFYLNETVDDLEARAAIFRRHVEEPLTRGDYPAIDDLCKSLGRQSNTRITVILPSGRVVGDSDEDPAAMEDHSDRPEIITAATTGETGSSIRYSRTLQTQMMYVAVAMPGEGDKAPVVRASIPLRSLDMELRGIYGRVVFGGFVIALIVAVVSYFVARRITRPIEELKKGADRFAEGELGTPLTIPDTEEIGSLAVALNRMAAQLDDRLNKMIQQRNEQEAVLASMVESVLAVDSDERVISLNHATARLFGIDLEESQGRPLQEVIRNPDLQRFAADALKSESPVEGEMTIFDPEERVLQVQGTVLRDSQGANIGALLVLYDITRLRRLEKVRRDFVANVSHELKTPITTISGFVETLMSGAMNEPKDAERFLKIIAKHADRLDAIIEDLLALSRLEQEAEKEEVVLERQNVDAVVRSAVDACRPRARSREIDLEVRGGSDIEAAINPRLLEQAIINLIDNAIKYSEPGGVAGVSVERRDGEIVISVEDHGAGIEKRHLPRLFERFYRTDRARSREQGGTGLGLAIVKHIALVHGGRVDVESVVGKGSVFTIYLPR